MKLFGKEITSMLDKCTVDCCSRGQESKPSWNAF